MEPTGEGEASATQAHAAGSEAATSPAASDAEAPVAAAPEAAVAETVATATAVAIETDPTTHRFECRSCGFVYDPGEGVRKLGIEAGTAFLDLDPLAFRCPVCRSRVGAFKDIGPRNKPSGFEENLNFGLGVNRLTPGQKNVLIFGGFALAIAFFLSLYSLR
ncbi:MAG: rubredoxin [Cyanobacteria bacterium REEB498]|nr:rubredoxin [Cyanobacteria bacterium REEB498]